MLLQGLTPIILQPEQDRDFACKTQNDSFPQSTASSFDMVQHQVTLCPSAVFYGCFGTMAARDGSHRIHDLSTAVDIKIRVRFKVIHVIVHVESIS